MLRSMDAQKFFFDDKRHLRSAWRLCLFVVVFFTCAAFVQVLLIGLIGFAASSGHGTGGQWMAFRLRSRSHSDFRGVGRLGLRAFI